VTEVASRARRIAGWTAVSISAVLSSFWAFWGSIENFHEGWYYRELWRNVGLAAVQYLPWMFIPMTAALLALWRPWAGVVAHLALAIGAVSLFGMEWSAGTALIALPLVGLAVLYGYGRLSSLVWARRVLIGLPLLTALVSGAIPGWRAITRPTTVDPSAREIAGNGVLLTWAPAGPGWNAPGLSWFQAEDLCARLSADGLTLLVQPERIWRLPTVDEAVRSMTWRGENAGGVWNWDLRKAQFRSQPDKEPPLWDPFSPVIYWWTGDEADANRAFRVVYNGYVTTLPKQIQPDYLSCRCVKASSEP
jgi:hypothetical protein